LGKLQKDDDFGKWKAIGAFLFGND
jgi:hypothetical protein